jgi:hypothetical protein
MVINQQMESLGEEKVIGAKVGDNRVAHLEHALRVAQLETALAMEKMKLEQLGTMSTAVTKSVEKGIKMDKKAVNELSAAAVLGATGPGVFVALDECHEMLLVASQRLAGPMAHAFVRQCQSTATRCFRGYCSLKHEARENMLVQMPERSADEEEFETFFVTLMWTGMPQLHFELRGMVQQAALTIEHLLLVLYKRRWANIWCACRRA